MSEKLNASAEDIFGALKLWVDSDSKNRRPDLANLLNHVKLPLPSTEVF